MCEILSHGKKYDSFMTLRGKGGGGWKMSFPQESQKGGDKSGKTILLIFLIFWDVLQSGTKW